MLVLRNLAAVTLVFGLAVYLAGITHVLAETPSSINIRGQLFGADGFALSGSREYIVRFYAQESGGSQLGVDVTGSAVVSDEGIFNLSLEPPAEILSSSEVWYEISVDSDAVPNGVDLDDLFPRRVKIESVPFALQAGEAQHVDAASVGAGTIDDAEMDALDGVRDSIQSQLDAKPDSADVYTKAEVDAIEATQDTAIGQNTADVETKTSFTWEVATESLTALPNHGYMADSESLLTFTLEPSLSWTVGDTVRFSGLGAGGWKVAQSEDQIVLLSSVEIPKYDVVFSKRMSTDDERQWRSVSSSLDGTRLIACAYDDYIYTSWDSGSTWTQRATQRNWSAVASSADGTNLFAAVNGGFLYTSVDAGETWIPRESERTWRAIASSFDGRKLVATHLNGYIYTTKDGGEVWTQQDSQRQWTSVASGILGARLVATTFNGFIYTSGNFGDTWVERSVERTWFSVASSADGKRLIAATNGGHLYTSTDSGVTWTQRGHEDAWFAVASSADGINLVAAANFGFLYRSTDSGLTWTPGSFQRNWYSIASSADGTKLIGAENPGHVYTRNPFVERTVQDLTTLGAIGAVTGAADAAIELQYLGNGTFRVLSHEGSLGAIQDSVRPTGR